jgi:hypothetical protein
MTTMRTSKLATLGATALVAALVTTAPASAATMNGVSLNGIVLNGIAVNGLYANGLSAEGGSTTVNAGAVKLQSLTLRDGRRLVVSEESEATASILPPVTVARIATSP